MKYIEFLNQTIMERVLNEEKIVLFGQNIDAGSCLSGLTRNLKIKKGLIINTQNSENTLCGVGFGLMLNNISSVFFMKQQDFLLLGIDHLVNTYNFIRQNNPLSSFTIMNSTVDAGYEGSQSRLNNLGDFCSIAGVPGFTITNKVDVEEIIKTHLISPGFRIIGASQRLFKQDLIDLEKVYSNDEKTLFQYKKGPDATIVCFNFSFPYGLELVNQLKRKGFMSSLFSVNSATPIKWDKIIEDLRKTKKLVVIDDSKSENLSCYNLLMHASDICDKKVLIKRGFSKESFSPIHDQLEINYEKIWQKLQS